MGITVKHTPEGLLLVDDAGRQHQYTGLLSVDLFTSAGRGALPTMKARFGAVDVEHAAEEFEHLAAVLRISPMVDTFKQWPHGYPVSTSIMLDPEGRWANWRVVTRLEREFWSGAAFRHGWTRTVVDAELPEKQNVVLAARRFKALCEYFDANTQIAEIG